MKNGFPWEVVTGNFLWIFGAAIILATISKADYMSRLHGNDRKGLLSLINPAFRKSIFLGVGLIAAGVSATINSPYWAALSAAVGLFFVLLLIRSLI